MSDCDCGPLMACPACSDATCLNTSTAKGRTTTIEIVDWLRDMVHRLQGEGPMALPLEETASHIEDLADHLTSAEDLVRQIVTEIRAAPVITWVKPDGTANSYHAVRRDFLATHPDLTCITEKETPTHEQP